MRILVLGATGMLGFQLFKTCLERNITVLAVVRNKQILVDYFGGKINNMIETIDDAKNINALEDVISKFKPDFVVNCIGIIKQSPLAENHYESISINSLLPHQLQFLGIKYGFRLIHISTDCVFDGRKGMYTENDPSDAYDLYGKTKFLGEVVYGCGITLRTSIIGHELTNHKNGLVDWLLSQKNQIFGYTKAIFSGVTTPELTRIIIDIIIQENIPSGLYQIAGNPISKFDLLNLIADIYDKQITISPSEEVVIDRSLDASKFNNLTSYKPPSWSSMLVQMHKNFMKI